MKIVIFGLSISSSWGNGHATLWRGLCRALAKRGHYIEFFEKDIEYYANHRDLDELPSGKLVLYRDWSGVQLQARQSLADADVGIVTSFCPDAIRAGEAVVESRVCVRCFYDLDTPVTLEELAAGKPPAYIGPSGLRDYDLVLSYTGGRALTALAEVLGARRVEPLYGSVDPDLHKPSPIIEHYRCDLSYLGTYAPDRQQTLNTLFLEPARRLPNCRFVVGGAMYPQDFTWSPNVFFVRHLPASEHSAFYSSSKLTLNVTRAAMAKYGFCPSGRLFEAAACGVPILSDWWEGLDEFFSPGAEVLVARNTEDTTAAVLAPKERLARIASAARERTLAEHTAEQRAIEFEAAVEPVKRPAVGGGVAG